MKKLFLFSLISLGLLFHSCANKAQTQTEQTSLSATDFAEKINANPGAAIIDVRTPDEFANGHLQHALNIDWSSADFDTRIAVIDKSKTIFVYCLSGARSAEAAAQMRANGFKSVYELAGGMMQWRAYGLPEAGDEKSNTTEMSRAAFNQLTQSDKIVLVDFYADWCAPCKKMAPYLDQISKEMADKVVLVRINADDNPTLCTELGIDALPTLQVYKGSNLSWNHVGYIEKPAIVAQLR